MLYIVLAITWCNVKLSIYYLTNFPALLHFPKNDKCSSKTFQLHCLLIVRMCAIFLVRYFSYLNLFYSSRKVRLSLLRRQGSILANPICAKARKIARVPIFENVKWLNNKSFYRFRVQRTAGEHRAHSKPSGHRHRQEPGHLHEEKVAAHHAHTPPPSIYNLIFVHFWHSTICASFQLPHHILLTTLFSVKIYISYTVTS